MAAAPFRNGHRGLCGMVYGRFDLRQTVASEIRHTGLGRGVNNGLSHGPLRRLALVLFSLVVESIPIVSNYDC